MLSLRLAYCAFATALGLAGCGGGSNDVEHSPSIQSAEGRGSASHVQLNGCVLDQYYIPKASAVRVLSADGRLVNRVLTDKDGRFSTIVPANQTVTISIDNADGGDALSIPIAYEGLSVGGCLVE